MRDLNLEEVAAVFGGDNPAMGPYVPPFTAQMQADYMNAMRALISWAGSLAGYIESQMVIDLQQRAINYNTRNGYTPDGSQYLWPAGVSGPIEHPIEMEKDVWDLWGKVTDATPQLDPNTLAALDPLAEAETGYWLGDNWNYGLGAVSGYVSD